MTQPLLNSAQSQLQHRKSSSKATPTKQSTGTSDGMSDSSESEGEQTVLRWAQKQRGVGKLVKPSVSLGDSSDSEDEDMPLLSRRKRAKPRPKPTKE